MANNDNTDSVNMRVRTSDARRIRILAAVWSCRPADALARVLDTHEALAVGIRQQMNAAVIQSVIGAPPEEPSSADEQPDPILEACGISR